jgi:type II secretory pathway component PulF
MPQFADYLARLTRRQLPLADGLRAYAADLEGSFSGAVAGVADLLREGHSLAAGMEAQGKEFDPRFVSIVRAGEESGTLPDMMASYVVQNRQNERTSERCQMALAYPIMTSLFLVGCMHLFAGKRLALIPQMMEEMGLPVGTLAEWWMSLGWRLGCLFLVILLTLSLLLITDFQMLRRAKGRGSPLRIKALSWLFGQKERLRSVGVFCETLAVLLKAGVPTARAVAVAADPGAIGRVDNATGKIADAVSSGEKLSDAMIRELRLSSSDAWRISAADGGEGLPEALAELSRLHQDRVTRRVVRASEIMLPVCVLVQAVLVFCMSLAALAPIFAIYYAFL